MRISKQEFVSLQCIHQGSNFMIYRWDTSEYGPVVIKLPENDIPEPGLIARLRREYELTEDLKIPGVRRAYETIMIDHRPALVLQYIEGATIRETLVEKPWTLSGTLTVAISIAKALGEIHCRSIIHKNINSHNIVVNREEQTATIIDFGLAVKDDPADKRRLQHSEVLESALHYISPEQTGRMNRFVDYRTDLYSIGVVIYEMLTGELPFDTSVASELIHCHIAKPPKPVCKLNVEIPKAVSDIVMKLMAKDAEDRYQSAYGLETDLANCLDQLLKTGTINEFNLAEKDYSGRFQISHKIYDREEEIQTILGAYNRVEKGTNETILVFGQSGVGKTLLISEIQKYVVDKRGYFISGSHDRYRSNIPFSAMIHAFTILVNQILSESTQRLARWKEKIAKAVGSNGQLLVEMIPAMELIIGPQQPVRELGPTEAQYRFHDVLQRFLKTIALKEHPLVIFIDNLQWVDVASMDFLKFLMTGADNQYILFIGAYRDDETGADHPLTMAVAEMKQARANINSIHLNSISVGVLNQLISEMLQCAPNYSKTLAQMIYEKTAGNPFVSIRFLTSLYEEGVLSFNFVKRKWHWDIDRIRAKRVTDSVADLMIQKVEKLSANTRRILAVAACIGNSFDLKTLAAIERKPDKVVSDSLLESVKAGLVLPQDENSTMMPVFDDEQIIAEDTGFEFCDERIRQASIGLLSKKIRQSVQLAIGRLLLKDTKEVELEKTIYEIVDHINDGFQYIKGKKEQLRLAELNLIAGRKAKNATAYQAAIWYLSMGIGLLKPDKWDRYYELTLKLYLEAVEAEYLSTNFERAELLSGEILKHARKFPEKIKVYELSILFYTAQNRNLEAINSGLEALEILGVSLPTDPEEINTYIEKSYNELSGEIERIEVLTDLPLMRDERRLAAMRILMNMTLPATKARLGLLPVIVFKMVTMSLKHGNSPTAAFVYGSHAAILIGAFGDIETGYRFGQLSVKMLEIFDATEIKAKVVFMFNTFVKHWKNDIAETIEPLKEVYQCGIETGDFEYAYYGALNHCSYLFCTGASLKNIRNIQAKYLEATERFRLKFLSDFGNIWAQTVLYLMGRSSDPCQLKRELFDESEMLPAWKKQNNGILVFCAYCCRTILQYMFGKYAEAIESARNAEEYKSGVTAFIYYPEHLFYYALALLAEYTSVDDDTKTEYLEKVDEIQGKFRQWIHHAPMNYQHKFDLIEAERIRVSADPLKAMKFYSSAILGSRKYKYLQDNALSYEREAEYYMELGRDEFARICMFNAYNSYRNWGAMCKVDDLERKYKYLSTQDTIVSLDSETIIKASQMLSREIRLDRLLDKMIHIVIENAGAQKGILIQSVDNRLVIQAIGEINQKQVETMQAIPIEESEEIPLSIVNYTARTKTPVVLNDASEDRTYSGDEYILKHQPKSLMCLPIIHQNKLSGLLYLENNLTTNAFTPDRLELLKVLSVQVAISIENAGLYTNLEERIKEREQAEEDLRKSETRFREFVEGTDNLITQVDGQGDFTYINSAVRKVLGIPPDAGIGLSAFSFIDERDRDRTKRWYARCVYDRIASAAIENRQVTIEGEVRDMIWTSNFHYDERGHVEYVNSIAQDITERKRFEQTLSEKEERFRSLLTNIPGAIYRCTIDPLWTMLFISDAIEDISGYPASDFVQNEVRAYNSIIHPDDREKVDKKVREGLKRQAPYTIEYRIIDADGKINWVHERGQGFFGGSEKASWLDGAIFDITEQKRIEIKLKQNENMLRQIFDTAPNSIFVKDRNGMYLLVNRKMAELHNTTPEELAGKYDYEIAQKWFETVNYKKFRKEEQIVIDRKETLYIPDEHYIFDDGHAGWFKTVKIPFELEDNKNCLLVISSDITERKRTEEELNKYRHQLEKLVETRTSELQTANKDLEAFAYSVSHDLRAPLRAIDGFTRILMEDYAEKLDTEGKRLGSVLRNNARKMGQLIDDLLNFSRLGRAAIRFSEIDMNNMVNNIYMESTTPEDRKRIEFSSSDLPRAIGDSGMMRQVWINVISNALKFSAKRKQAVISVSCRKEENSLIYSVKDNGAGFDMRYSDKLFGVFQRLHSEREFEGNGVGLALVQRIIHRHDGEVWAEGEVDKGAVFYFSVPRNRGI
ncbi:MAG: PAS domain S-box protein [Candidatus Sabulitectum sp.]|nr:PAS domain S-box protein [Candidatus Sabulitectum sp.]